MKRFYYTLSTGVMLAWGLAWLMTWTPTVQAQTNPNASAAPNAVYLPLISSHVSRIKGRSGIHLGNRNSSDWRQELFTNISTATVTGTWPAAVTVQSDQLYNLYRYVSDKCRIVAAGVKETGAHEPYNLYKYLTAAVQAGTVVVIRITPSPGNFIDYAQPGRRPHTLLATEQPAGGDYCGNGEEQKTKIHQYRDIQDIAEEMQAIYQVNTNAGWPPTSFFFEPANEPNQEWYQSLVESGVITLTPNVDNKQAWIAMDEYFAALYDKAKALKPALQILSPSQSQELYSEHYVLGTCTKVMVSGDSKNRSGMDFMKKTFGYDPDAADPYPDPKADGFAWHNYWRPQHEAWEQVSGPVPTIDRICDGKPPTDTLTVITSDHVIQYLSEGMLQQIAPRPTFINEADRKSPCQAGTTGAAVSKDDDPAAIRDSLVRFINAEVLGQYVIAWLLVNQDNNEADTCRDPAGHFHQNYENNWHEAYQEDANGVYERDWFHLWWPAAW